MKALFARLQQGQHDREFNGASRAAQQRLQPLPSWYPDPDIPSSPSIGEWSGDDDHPLSSRGDIPRPVRKQPENSYTVAAKDAQTSSKAGPPRQPRIVPLPADSDSGSINSDNATRGGGSTIGGFGVNSTTVRKPPNGTTVRKPPNGTTTTVRKPRARYARESSANAKFGTRLITPSDSPIVTAAGRRPASRRTAQANQSSKPSSGRGSVTRPSWNSSTREASQGEKQTDTETLQEASPQDVKQRLKEIARREAALAQGEADARQRDAALQAREEDIGRREADLKEREDVLAVREASVRRLEAVARARARQEAEEMPHVQHSTLNEEQSARKPGQARLDRRLLSRRALAREMVPSVVDPAGPRTEDTKQQQQADGGAQYTDVTNGHQRVDSLSELIERLPIASRFLLPTFPSDTPPDPTIDTASLGREHTDTPNMHQLETVARATARQEQDSEEMRVQHRSRARARLPRMKETRALVAYQEGVKAEEPEPQQADGGNYAAVAYWVGDELLDGPTGTDHVSADLDNDDALTELSMSDIKSMNSMYSSKTRVMMSFTGPG